MTNVHGIVLHYYDKGVNSDKFYRTYYHELPTGGYRVVYVWGRDGSKGQKKIETFARESVALREIEDKAWEKMHRKDYTKLGEGDVWVEPVMLDEVSYISDRLFALHGKPPNKSKGTGYDFIIVEQELPEDLIARLMGL